MFTSLFPFHIQTPLHNHGLPELLYFIDDVIHMSLIQKAVDNHHSEEVNLVFVRLVSNHDAALTNHLRFDYWSDLPKKTRGNN